MRLAVLGANGRTGERVVRLALKRGDQVTAVVRSDAKRPEITHRRLRVAVGDPCDPAFLAVVFKGQDAVISTLGGRAPARRATSIYWRSADAMARALRQAADRKLAVTSTALLFPPARLSDRLLAGIAYQVVRSARRMKDHLKTVGCDVVIVRCGFLTEHDEPRYRMMRNGLPEGGSSVSRDGLAHGLLDAAAAHDRQFSVFGVSRP